MRSAIPGIETIRPVAIIAVAVLIVAVAFLQVRAWANSYYLGRAQQAAQSTLLLVSGAIDQSVGRFAPMPALIASDPVLQGMLVNDAPQDVTLFVNEKLRQIAISIGASEVYMMNADGLTVAASNYRDDDSFMGQSFSFRPYFMRALEGKSAVFHALGTTSGERGFFFSAPVLDGIEVVGVVAVKITVGSLEQDWQGAGREILIADADGIVFLSSRQDYRFRALAPLSAAVTERIKVTRQFPVERVVPIEFSADVIAPSTVQVTLGADADSFLADSIPLDLAGWHAIVLTPLQPVQAQVFRTLAVCLLVLTAVTLAGLVVAQRRANIVQRMRIEQEQRALLEDRVRDRTADLNAEVQERRRAEERLRKSQKELVQAGKLAALGQMSAAISHEINQPLSAIKSYAVNASEFLARDRVAEADENIKSISLMSDRMAEISRHLRNFARRPGDKVKPIDVSAVITETIGLVGPQLRARDATVLFESTGPVMALGGHLRLQQVLVNIITNALEAMADDPNPVVIIETAVNDGVTIHVRDHGPGLQPDSMDQVFDAFYTTKDAGAGMGLGMSISYNIIRDFGGSLSAENHPDGGAVFTVALDAES